MHLNTAGISRAEEEKYLTDTIEVAQKNLDHAYEEIKTLTEDTENFMFEANKSKDEAILTLWNNVRAQLEESKRWLIRTEKARKKPYFGRIDFQDLSLKSDGKTETYYIGRVGIAKSTTEPVVIDWRAPVASLYYDNGIGKGSYSVDVGKTYDIDLKRKRTYEIENDVLRDFYDMDVVSNDELLTKYLSKNKTEVLSEIIATIQQEQNRIIRRSPKTNVIVQGVAGSGKTTVAMHRISYILFNFAEEFRPEDFYIIGSNKILLNYITGVLPELDVYGAKQMTMEELFIRLLYEDWNQKKYSWHELDKQQEQVFVKGTKRWFEELEEFCRNYEKEQIPCEDIILERYEHLLLSKERIAQYIQDNPQVSLQSKRLMLNEILYAQYENFMTGRHAKFTEEERKELDTKYCTYFAKWGKYGRSDWDGSIFDLYRAFLLMQNEKGYAIPVPENSFDVYDLAALSYLYKRIKEIDPIREASHVVIDEAQDFGMMAYQCLYYCMRGCTYTIMGDTSQNIHYQYGLNDWTDLRELVLTGQRDAFLTLKKSYRNTVEISDFATEILRHGNFAIYPVEPIVRHGNPVNLERCASSSTMVSRAVDTIEEWKKQGYETIAVVCRDEKETKKVVARLKEKIAIKDMGEEEASFGSGVMVLPVAYTKGLEFDAVLIWDPTIAKYPEDDGHVKMLYVAATRALHELNVVYIKNLTALISKKAPEHKYQEAFTAETVVEEYIPPKISEKEQLEQQKADASREMEERNYMGPARIQAIPVGGVKVGTTMVKQPQAVKKSSVKPVASVVRQSTGDYPVNESPYRYGEIPKNTALAVKGHMKANLAVKWVKKTKTSLEITSNYGVLSIIPITEECIRIQFVKGMQAASTEDSCWKTSSKAGLKWTARESSTTIEFATSKVVIRIEKRDGALKFMTSDRKLLLSERSSDARFIEDQEVWNFFEFERSDKVKSKGPIKDDFTDITNKARYISVGGRKLHMPLILSNKGYALAICAEKTAMYNGIRTYGQYIYTEGQEKIDYFFLYGKNNDKNIQLYQEL